MLLMISSDSVLIEIGSLNYDGLHNNFYSMPIGEIHSTSTKILLKIIESTKEYSVKKDFLVKDENKTLVSLWIPCFVAEGMKRFLGNI